MSKGSNRRPMDVSQQEYYENYDRIFGRKHNGVRGKRKHTKRLGQATGGKSEGNQQ